MKKFYKFNCHLFALQTNNPSGSCNLVHEIKKMSEQVQLRKNVELQSSPYLAEYICVLGWNPLSLQYSDTDHVRFANMKCPL